MSTLILCWPCALGLSALGAAPASAASGPVMYPNGIGADLGPTPDTLGTTVTAGPSAAGLLTVNPSPARPTGRRRSPPHHLLRLRAEQRLYQHLGWQVSRLTRHVLRRRHGAS